MIALIAPLFTALLAIAMGAAPATAPATKPTAKMVAFVVDARASMLDSFKDVQIEMQKSISGLDQNQSFEIFSIHERTIKFPLSPTLATDDMKRQAVTFLGRLRTSGEGEPTSALTYALKTNPDMIYFASNGQFQHPELILPEVKKAYALHPAPIFCCATSADEKGRRCMFEIAQATGGQCFDLKGIQITPTPAAELPPK